MNETDKHDLQPAPDCCLCCRTATVYVFDACAYFCNACLEEQDKIKVAACFAFGHIGYPVGQVARKISLDELIGELVNTVKLKSSRICPKCKRTMPIEVNGQCAYCYLQEPHIGKRVN